VEILVTALESHWNNDIHYRACTVQTAVVQLHRHYKSCRESHAKERLKRKALGRPRKTDIEGVDVTCWDRLFQVRTAVTVKA